MSIVAVHGPNTFGSKGVVKTGPAFGQVDNTNSLKWDFKLDGPTTRPDQDFSWAFPPDGTPTPQVKADPLVVTYASAGTKTATMTVSNVSRTVNNKALTNNVATLTTSVAHGFKIGQSVVVSAVDATFNGTYTLTGVPTGTTLTYDKVATNVTSAVATGAVASDPAQYPPAAAYPIIVTAAVGTGAQTGLLEAAPPEEQDNSSDLEVAFDPAAHTVTEVIGFVEDNPDLLEDVIEAEEAGKQRTTLLQHLESMRQS